jgi:hypothetical protein
MNQTLIRVINRDYDDEEEDDEEEDDEEDDEYIMDFDQYSNKVYQLLRSTAYRDLRGGGSYGKALDAFDGVELCIKAIGDRTYDDSHYATKLNALERLRMIAETVLEVRDALGSQVRKQFQLENPLPGTMLRILRSMTPEEQRRAGANSDAKGSLTEKVRWVHEEAKGYCLMGVNALGEVLSLLSGEVVEKVDE